MEQLNGSDVFMTDPFLALDNDLDDVSEVIRSNMVSEHGDYRNASETTARAAADAAAPPPPLRYGDECVSVACFGAENDDAYRNVFDAPHRGRDTEERQKQIGHIVSLLQDDTMATRRINANVPCSAQNDEKIKTISSLRNCMPSKIGQITHQHHHHHESNQQYFINTHESDVNFAALDSGENSPLDKTDFSHFSSDAVSVASHAEYTPAGPGTFGPASNAAPLYVDCGGSGGTTRAAGAFQEFRPARSYFAKSAVSLDSAGAGYADVTRQHHLLMKHDDVFMGAGAGMEDMEQGMLHSGLSDEMLHIASLHDDLTPLNTTAQFATHSACSNSNSMPSPSLSDLFPAGDVFPSMTAAGGASHGVAQFYLDDSACGSPSPASPQPAPAAGGAQISPPPPHVSTSYGNYPGVDPTYFTESNVPYQQHHHSQHAHNAYMVQEFELMPPSTIVPMDTVKMEQMTHEDVVGLTTNTVAPITVHGIDNKRTVITDEANEKPTNGDETSQKKNDLMRMLLEMSHNELESLRLTKNNSVAEIEAGVMRKSRRVGKNGAKISTASLSSTSLEQLQAQCIQQIIPSTTSDEGLRDFMLAAPECQTPAIMNGFDLNFNDKIGGNLFDTSVLFVAKSEESDDESDPDQPGGPNNSQQIHNNTSKRGPKTERRTAHNLIEKKYRCSINDRINHLKTMLAADETKLSKSATLRKAIEHINTLRAQNGDLLRENGQLRSMLEAANVPLATVPTAAAAYDSVTPFPVIPEGKLPSFSMGGQNANNTSSPESSPGSSASNSLGSAKTSAAATKTFTSRQSRKITLCVFVFVLMAFNPLAGLIASNAGSGRPRGLESQQYMYAHHRTLAGLGAEPQITTSASGSIQGLGSSSANIFLNFDYGNNTIINSAFNNMSLSANATFWLYESSTIRRAFVWFLNILIVGFVLARLFVYTEPVVDGQSIAWREFCAARERATRALAARNYGEAHRQLGDALQFIGRELPDAGGVEEAFSVVWQVVRHVLNSIWVGRWLARRRRSATQPSAAVCRAHAATALVYHQIHQLHLIGVNGVELNEIGGLNLALIAVNLAESAGISRHGVSHRVRAEIYVNAALRAKFTCRYFGALSHAYFMRRAKRHVRKAQMLEAADVRALQWIFHPLGRKFLKGHVDIVAEILRSSKRALNFPFSDAQISPKPTECLMNAFKMHLLSLLMEHLTAVDASNRGTFTDFVEISHLLLELCRSCHFPLICSVATTPFLNRKTSYSNEDESRYRSASPPAPRYRSPSEGYAQKCTRFPNYTGASPEYGSGAHDEDAPAGDELCTWWTHLVTGALYWLHGDNAHARKHYAIVRQCPKLLLNNDLALSMGLAFCARKMCKDDRLKRKFAEMVWIHVQKSFQHLERDNFSTLVHKNVDIVSTMQKRCRAVTCEWIMTSLLDMWNHQRHASRTCWQHCAQHLIRKLYTAAYKHFESCDEFVDEKKLVALKILENGTIWFDDEVSDAELA